MDDKEITTNEILSYMKEKVATKADLANLREEIKSDVDVILDQHLQTYMKRYDELVHRIKRIEEHIDIEPYVANQP